MASALALARRSLGQTWPNPAVGCLIVRDGRLLGRGVIAKHMFGNGVRVIAHYLVAAARAPQGGHPGEQ